MRRFFSNKIVPAVCLLLGMASFGALPPASASGGAGYSREEALRVLELIERIQSEQLKKAVGDVRKISVTESELNSYIAYRIETENEETMRELRLKLFKNNRIEGKIVVDLKSQRLPKILKPRMNLYFAADLENKEGALRMNLKKLFVEDQVVQTEVLDFIIFIASRIENTVAFSLSDWFVLPFGIKHVKTEKGRAVFSY